MSSSPTLAWAFVVAQFLFCYLIVHFGPRFPAKPAAMLLVVSGASLGLWALWEMRRARFSVAPIPREGTSLLTSGPYSKIRHPMYTGLLLVMLAWVIQDWNPVAGVFWILLVGTLIGKIMFEERLLADRFPEYRDYILQTKRLVPGLF